VHSNDFGPFQTLLQDRDHQSFFSRVISHIFGGYKPSPTVYPAFAEYCRRCLNLLPTQVLVVSTSLYRDIEPATDAGFPCAWVRHEQLVREPRDCFEVHPAFEIKDMSALESLLLAPVSRIEDNHEREEL